MKVKKDDAKGLVYLPANVRLYQFVKKNLDREREHGGSVTRWHELEKPMNVLVLETDREYVQVLYNSEKWYVKQKDVYEIRG